MSEIVINSSIVRNISIDEFTTEPIKNLLEHYLDQKDLIVQQHTEIAQQTSIIGLGLNTLCHSTIDNGYRLLTTDDSIVLIMPFLFKFREKLIPLYEYHLVHVYWSVIRTVLLEGEGSLATRIQRMLYILYSFEFYKNNTSKDIIHNVVIDIESIIAYLIDNGLTKYSNYIITGEAVLALRERLIMERLSEAGEF